MNLVTLTLTLRQQNIKSLKMTLFSRISRDDIDRESEDEDSNQQEAEDQEEEQQTTESDGIVHSRTSEGIDDPNDTMNDVEDELDEEPERPPKKKYQSYAPYKYFMTKESACLAMKEDGDEEGERAEDEEFEREEGEDEMVDPVRKYTWKFRQTQGKTHWYDCAHIGCQVRLKLMRDPPKRDKGTWAIYNSDCDHDHSKVPEIKERGLSDQIKALIADYESKLFKPQRMIGLLRARRIEPPKIQQINTYLKTLRKANLKKATGSVDTKWSLTKLKNFVDLNTLQPGQIVGPDHVFVASFEYELKPKIRWRVFLTTKRLLAFVRHVSVNC